MLVVPANWVVGRIKCISICKMFRAVLAPRQCPSLVIPSPKGRLNTYLHFRCWAEEVVRTDWRPGKLYALLRLSWSTPGEARCLGAEGGTLTYQSGRGPGILTPGEAIRVPVFCRWIFRSRENKTAGLGTIRGAVRIPGSPLERSACRWLAALNPWWFLRELPFARILKMH